MRELVVPPLAFASVFSARVKGFLCKGSLLERGMTLGALATPNLALFQCLPTANWPSSLCYRRVSCLKWGTDRMISDSPARPMSSLKNLWWTSWLKVTVADSSVYTTASPQTDNAILGFIWG